MQLLTAIGFRSERILMEVYTFGILLQRESCAQAEHEAPKTQSAMQLRAAETLLEILQERSRVFQEPT